MTQNVEDFIKSPLEVQSIAVDDVTGKSLQLLNMRGTHLALILCSVWIGCCLTVGLSIQFGWLWGYTSGLVDGQRDTSARIAALTKVHQVSIDMFERQLKAFVSNKAVQVPDVSTFMVFPNDKVSAPQVIQVKSEPTALPDNLSVTIKNIKDLLPKAVTMPEKPEKPVEVKKPEEPKKTKEVVESPTKDGTVGLPAPGETKEWIKAHEKNKQ